MKTFRRVTWVMLPEKQHLHPGRATWVTNLQVGGWGGWAPSLTVNRVKPPEWPTPRWVDEEGEHHHSPWTVKPPEWPTPRCEDKEGEHHHSPWTVKPPEWPTPRCEDKEGEHHHSPWTAPSGWSALCFARVGTSSPPRWCRGWGVRVSETQTQALKIPNLIQLPKGHVTVTRDKKYWKATAWWLQREMWRTYSRACTFASVFVMPFSMMNSTCSNS